MTCPAFSRSEALIQMQSHLADIINDLEIRLFHPAALTASLSWCFPKEDTWEASKEQSSRDFVCVFVALSQWEEDGWFS